MKASSFLCGMSKLKDILVIQNKNSRHRISNHFVFLLYLRISGLQRNGQTKRFSV